MENSPEMVVLQNADSIGGNYAPDNSHVSSKGYLTGLTPHSYEQFNGQNSTGVEDDLDYWFGTGSYDFEDENISPNNFADDFATYQVTGNIDDLQASAPKCPEDYVEPPVARRRRFNSDSAAHKIASPITDSLAAFSQQVMPIQKTTESTSLLNTTPKVTSETTQKATGQELPLSGSNNSSNSELPITPSNGQVTGLPTPPIIISVSPLNNLSQSSVDTTTTPEIYQTPSASHMLVLPEGGVAGVPLAPMMTMHVDSHAYDPQSLPQKPRSPLIPFTGFSPAQKLDFEPFRRSKNHQSTSIPRGSVATTQKSTEQATNTCLPSRPTSNITHQQSSLQALDRSSIKPQLREVMEKFETKIKMDEDLRRAFNIVFPSRVTEVETLKQTILNERRQAAIREKALRREIKELQENAINQDALQSRAMDILAQLRANPPNDRPWVCLNYDRDTGRLCHRIHREFYLANKVWKRRERCTKCRARTFEKNRIYFNNDEEVSAWTARNANPVTSNSSSSLKRTRDMLDNTENQSSVVDPTRRQSLPTLTVAEQGLQQNAASRWASVPPPTKKKARDHAPLSNSKDTQNTLRAALGTPTKSWMQEPKPIETIVLDDDSEEVETDQSQESSDDSRAGQKENNDAMDAEFEAELEAEFTAALEAGLA
ncbi:hypothetical protein DSL72_001627 [Monilinia vaccinii-corymbosi]|uniref:Uncharacterized protein n=1 Tax=Monilinia vaccinii-corymbosi TaxID=61207 RepID=A0A8A3P9G3_9HELO|nr:hypothetical protein DSL72_001627 [Monilinia vaccinii-corymbosi]